MTRDDWLTATDPEPMLRFLVGRQSERKFRLFACACCRAVALLVKPTVEELCQQAIEAAELRADERLGPEELAAIHIAAERAKPLFADASWAAVWTTAPDALQAAAESSLEAARSVARSAAQAAESSGWAAVRSGAPEEVRRAAWQRFEEVTASALATAREEQARLLRELVGDPFADIAIPAAVSVTVVQLAEAVYAGLDCAFALHDALLEAGHLELAEHFQGEQWHPKGCWAVDLLLGKS